MCSSLTKKTQQIKRVRSLLLFSQRPDVLQLLPSLNFWVLLICFVWHEKKIFDIQDLQVKHILCFDFFARRSGMYLFMGTRSWWCIEMVVLVVMYRWWWSTGKKSSCSLEEAASNQTWCLHEELHMICFYFLQYCIPDSTRAFHWVHWPKIDQLWRNWMIVVEWSSSARDSLKSVTKWLQVMRCRITCPRDSHPSEHTPCIKTWKRYFRRETLDIDRQHRLQI